MIAKVLTMMGEGCSPTEVAAELGLSKKKFLECVNEDPNLNEAFQLGLTKYEAWFEKVGKGLMLGKIQGKEGTWKTFGQKHFGYSDKTEVTESKPTAHMTPEELDAYIASLSGIKVIEDTSERE